MTPVELFLLMFASWGVMFTITYSEIFEMLGIRQRIERVEFFKKLIHCSFCIGTWIGAIYGIFCFILLLNSLTLFFYIATLPFATATFVYSWERIIFAFDEYINHVDDHKIKRKRLDRKKKM